MGVACMVVALLAAIYALWLIRTAWRHREYGKAIKTGKWLLIGAGAYLVVLIAVSLSSSGGVASGGEEIRLCDALGDCTLAASVLQVDRTRTLGNPPQEMVSAGMYYVVTVKVISYEPNPTLNPRDLSGVVVDENGNEYPEFQQGEREAETGLGENRFSLQVSPTGGSYKRMLVFDLPGSVQNPTLIVRAGGWLDRTLQLFIIGEDNSLFHPTTRLALNLPERRR